MSSRDSILSAVKTNQPAFTPLPSLDVFANQNATDVQRYINTLQGIGGRVFSVSNMDEVKEIIAKEFPTAKRIISTIDNLAISTDHEWKTIDPHLLESVDLAIIKPKFGVAENGSVWVTEDDLTVRVLPFICEHLAAVVSQKSLVETMHQAYDLISDANYGFGVFIAGPSKTADIEQSLVLGAHGPKTMTIFLMKD